MWFLCGIFLLVADVEVKGDGVFIRLRKEEVVCEDKDSSTRVSSSDVRESVVEKVPECSGSEVTGSSDITSISLDTVLDLNLAS